MADNKTNDSPLLPGETLLWTGMPVQGWVFTLSDWFAIPFSLIWGGFVIFWNVGVWTNNAPFFFKLWGLPFLAIGLFMMVGRFILDRWNRSRTHYAVTNQRVLISEKNGAHIRSFPINGLPSVEMTEAAGAAGSIRFGPQSVAAQAGFQMRNWPGGGNTSEFFRIADVRKVYDLIQKTANAKPVRP